MEKPSGTRIYFYHSDEKYRKFAYHTLFSCIFFGGIYSYIYQTLPATSTPSLFYSILSDLRWNNIDSFQFPSCFIVMTSETRTSKLTYDLNVVSERTIFGKMYFLCIEYYTVCVCVCVPCACVK